MKNTLRLFLLLAIVLLPLAATVQPAYAAPVLDQWADYNSGQLNSYYHWQQGIRTGVAGQLMGIDVWCVGTTPLQLSIWLGAPWHNDAPLYQATCPCTATNGWTYVDLSAGGIVLAAEQYFTVGYYSGVNDWFGGADYGRGEAYYDGVYFPYTDTAFRTYMQPARQTRVDSITGAVKLTRQGLALTANAYIDDDADAPVPGATVHATLTAPGKAPVQLQAVTDAAGKATFTGVSARRGTWTLCVDDVVLAGYTFAPGASDCHTWNY